MSSHTSPTALQPPKRIFEDPGAHELDSSENEDDHFSDASEGRPRRSSYSSQRGRSTPGHSTPEEASGGVTNVASPSDSLGHDPYGFKHSESPVDSKFPEPGGQPVPITVVEKVDPFTPSYGEVPGTLAYDARKADAAPDVVMATDASEKAESAHGESPKRPPVPQTKVTIVDDPKGIPGTEAFEKHKQDAEPDVIEQQSDDAVTRPPAEATPTLFSSEYPPRGQAGEGQQEHTGGLEFSDEASFGHAAVEFDDFEEGGGNDDFGDFDDGFAGETVGQDVGPAGFVPVVPTQPLVVPPAPILDFKSFNSPEQTLEAVTRVVDEMFTSSHETASTSAQTLPVENTMFATERSQSLWYQLVASPPLQPPNWVRSRIRRLFLVSLGVPVDLDEILPTTKQKKLVLPSTQTALNGNGASRGAGDAQSRGGPGAAQSDATNANGRQESSLADAGRKGQPTASDFDASVARLACGTTEVALTNFTDEELQAHVAYLESLRQQAQASEEYWARRRDDATGDKAAFEGVIENLVKHARRVRK